MTLRAAVVRERLQKLRAVVRNLADLRAIPKDVFVSDHRHFWLAERGLVLAAEAMFDVGTHILVSSFNVSPRDYEDVTRKLLETGVVSQALGERLRGLGGFRNILVHGYLDIDEGIVYDHLRDGLHDFLDFAQEIEDFIERAPAR